MPRLTQRDFERLLEFRVTLRRFQRWSEDQAQEAGLTQVQHQLLVAIKGYPGDVSPTVGELAGYLLLRRIARWSSWIALRPSAWSSGRGTPTMAASCASA